MASEPLTPVVSAKALTTDFQDLFTVDSTVARFGIDAVVFNNHSSSNVTITVRLIQSGASTELNEVITEQTIRSKESFLAPAMIGQGLTTGGIIQVKASANSAISAHITGTKILATQ